MIGVKRRDDQAIGLRIEVEAQSADVTAIALASARLRLELAMTQLRVAGRTVPGHGITHLKFLRITRTTDSA